MCIPRRGCTWAEVGQPIRGGTWLGGQEGARLGFPPSHAAAHPLVAYIRGEEGRGAAHQSPSRTPPPAAPSLPLSLHLVRVLDEALPARKISTTTTPSCCWT